MNAKRVQGGTIFSQPLVETGDALASIELFLERGWTDGLPIIPPTEDRVEAFLATVDNKPDEVLLTVPENLRQVTVELAAINAVMAGCAPQYFPVVVAALKGWADDRWGMGDRAHFYMGIASTGGAAQLLIVNGPIRHELEMNSGVNFYGPGNRANATIGRAMRLITINALGMAPGVLDESSQGHPGKYSFCFAENEEENPWDPLHVEHGFGHDESTVATFAARGPEPVENREANTPEGILFAIADTMSKVSGNLAKGWPTIVALGPEHAGIIAKSGWSKADVKQFLYEHFKRTVADLTLAGRWRFASEYFETIDGVPYVRGCLDPADIVLVVAGGNNAGVSSVITTWCYKVPHGDCVITPIEAR